MIVVVVDVAQESGDSVHVVYDSVHFAVVEDVTYRQAARGHRYGEGGVFDRGYWLQALACEVVEEQRALGPGGAPVVDVGVAVDVAVDLKKVLPAIIVVVDEGCAPAEEGDSEFSDLCVVADVGKVGIAIVTVERLVVVGKGGVVDVEEAVVAVVADGDAHGGSLTAFFVQSISGGVALVVELAVAHVDVEVIGGGVISDEQVGFAVVIDVDED